MTNTRKILVAVFSILVLVVTAEIFYYLGYTSSQEKKTEALSQQAVVTQTPKKTPSLTKEDIAILNDPYYYSFAREVYDEANDRICMDITPKQYINWRKNMGINLAAWISISTFTKGTLESMIVYNKMKGTISNLDANKMRDGKRFYFYRITSDDGIYSDFYEYEETIKKTKIVKLVNGQEVPISFSDLKNGDRIIQEGKGDLMKAPEDPNFVLEAKIIVQ